MKSAVSWIGIAAIVGAVSLAVFIDLSARGLRRFPVDPVWEVPGGQAEHGREAFIRHGCGACHELPSVTTATGRVGPRLDRLGEQIYIAGVLPNTPENLIEWIQRPREINPLTAMPNLGVTEQEARDIAALLIGGEANGQSAVGSGQ